MQTTDTRKGSTPWLPSLMLFALVAYFLSIGPAESLYSHGLLGREEGLLVNFLRMLYAPLEWLQEASETFDEIEQWYIELWMP